VLLPRYQRWTEERAAVLGSLGRRAAAITKALNGLPGLSCVAAGSLYAFPRIVLPAAAVAAANKAGLAPDLMWVTPRYTLKK